MKNLDEILLEELKKALTELYNDYSEITTIGIIEKITGSPYTPSYSTNNIGLTSFISNYETELGLEFLNYESSYCNEYNSQTAVWRFK
jgi:hypothetical protein